MIVGLDRVPLGFLRAKLESEQIIEQSGLSWTILRATEFHDLMLRFLTPMAKGPLVVVIRSAQFQPVDVREVADRVAELVTGEPAGRVPGLSGPRGETTADLLRAFLHVTRGARELLARLWRRDTSQLTEWIVKT